MTTDQYNGYLAGADSWNNDTSANIGFNHSTCTNPCSGFDITGDVTYRVSDYRSAFTNLTYNQVTHEFISAHMLINSWSAGGYSVSELQSVTAHEMGHAVGLDHNSAGQGCGNVCCQGSAGPYLMYPTDARYEVCGIKTPQGDDNNGVNSLY